MGELWNRRQVTEARFKELQSNLSQTDSLISGKACVYVTGSFGRGEASSHSDLDLFIVGKRNGVAGPDGKEGSLLNRLDQILLKADLIDVSRKLNFPEFSGDGRYLTHYSVHELVKTLGWPEDDATNTLTARLLLLLESRPLLGTAVYELITGDVIAAYWRDYEDHKTNFIPAFLANDILRLWRTFCVNYEARSVRDPARERAKGKLKNYKLKHSRLLTCYSAILYLLATYRLQNTVSPADAVEMIKLTPTQRIEWLQAQLKFSSAQSKLDALLAQYERFLENTDADEATLVSKFMDKQSSRALMGDAYTFGDLMFGAMSEIGGGERFHRLLVV